MRDFHAQKDLFRAIHSRQAAGPETGIQMPSWVVGHCYVIDVFLRFMAEHGYTLQKSRHAGEFLDVSQTIRAHRDERLRHAFPVKLPSAAEAPESGTS